MIVGIKLNPRGSIELNLFSWEVPDNLPLQEFKYEKPEKVLANIPNTMVPLVSKMIDCIKEYDSRDICIDYKVRDLKTGAAGSGIHGWHLDCTNNIHDDLVPETHIIFGTGQGTHFIMNEIDVSTFKTVGDVIANAEIVEMICTPNVAHKYTSKVLHNCPVMESDCQRVLIRVTAGFYDRIKNAKR